MTRSRPESAGRRGRGAPADAEPQGGDESPRASVSPPQAPADALAGDRTAGAHLTNLLLDLLGRIETRVNAAGAGRDADALHALRVATRRTRVALARVKGVLPDDVTERFGRGFRQFQRSSGAKRDLDVLVARVATECASMSPSGRCELEPFVAHLEARLDEEGARLARVLEADDTTTLLRDWRAFLESYAPVDSPETAPPRALEPVDRVASDCLWKAWRKLRRASAEIDDDAPVTALHALRIDGKRLRYLLEFFGGLFDEKEVQRLSKSLTRLQNALGELNDMDNQRALLRAFARSLADEGGDDTPDALLALGGLLQRLDDREERIRPKALARVASFLDDPRPRQVKRLLGR